MSQPKYKTLPVLTETFERLRAHAFSERKPILRAGSEILESGMDVLKVPRPNASKRKACKLTSPSAV